jgi:hypothetical protein
MTPFGAARRIVSVKVPSSTESVARFALPSPRPFGATFYGGEGLGEVRKRQLTFHP